MCIGDGNAVKIANSFTCQGKKRIMEAGREVMRMASIVQTLAQNLPALLCLVVGYALVVLEMCVPGFGVLGVSGIVLLVTGTILGTATLTEALILAGILLALVLLALPLCMRMISKGKLSNTKLVLNEVSVRAEDEGHALDRYVGREGQALTILRPAGIAEFEGEKVNVVSDGSYIGESARVRVERVEGNRVVVTLVK